MNCPVCKKAGIPEDVDICPQCDSDLTQFKIIKSIEKSQRINKRIIFLLIILIIFSLSSISLVYFNGLRQRNINTKELVESGIDSVMIYKSLLSKANQKIESLEIKKKDSAIVNYEVKKNDNLTKISYLFYGNTKMICDLAKENNIQDIDIIYIGQIIKVNLKF